MEFKLKNRTPHSDPQRLLAQHSRTTVFYGLPKAHKPDNPLCPIASCGEPLDKLSWFVQQILTRLLTFIPAHLTNTHEYIKRLTEKFPERLSPGSIVFSLDVYGCIPVQEGIDAVMKLLETNASKSNTFGVSLTDIQSILNLALMNNYIRFGSQFYQQTSGIAMGNRVAPPEAIDFMHIMETGFMSAFQYLPVLYICALHRYFRNTDSWHRQTHGVCWCDPGPYNQSIPFTIEHPNNTGRLSFLDTLVSVQPCGSYKTEHCETHGGSYHFEFRFNT